MLPTGNFEDYDVAIPNPSRILWSFALQTSVNCCAEYVLQSLRKMKCVAGATMELGSNVNEHRCMWSYNYRLIFSTIVSTPAFSDCLSGIVIVVLV